MTHIYLIIIYYYILLEKNDVQFWFSFWYVTLSWLYSCIKLILNFKEHIDQGKYPVTRTSQGRGNVFGYY